MSIALVHNSLHEISHSKTSWNYASVPHHVSHGAPHCFIRAHPAPICRCCPASDSHRSHRPVILAACCSVASEACAGVQLGWNVGFNSKFNLGKMLGRGSFGTVHEAVHKLTGNRYAVKVLSKNGKHAMRLDAISREVDTWKQALGSKFVAKLEGLYEDDDHAYIVQELCAGGDLKALLDANGCVSELEAATVMRGVLDMLVECHRRNICYGDLKPANIMFSQTADSASPSSPRAGGSPRLHVRAVDFGCSRVSAKGRPLTQCCGSPLYMAPEMALQRYGVAVDVWAAGVMMYQMLTGRLPFWRSKSLEDISKLPPYEIVAAVRTYEVQFPRDVWSNISPNAQDLVSRMLDRNPATRITAEQALSHPWLVQTLGYVPTPSGNAASNNVVEFPGHLARSGSGNVPAPMPLSPSRSSSNGSTGGALSPSGSLGQPLKSRCSAELPASFLVADMVRAQVPVMVPAAE